VTLIRAYKKVGRNEPCPCGSGKKLKHCDCEDRKVKDDYMEVETQNIIRDSKVIGRYKGE